MYNVIRFRSSCYNAVSHKHFCARELKKLPFGEQAHPLNKIKIVYSEVGLIAGITVLD